MWVPEPSHKGSDRWCWAAPDGPPDVARYIAHHQDPGDDGVKSWSREHDGTAGAVHVEVTPQLGLVGVELPLAVVGPPAQSENWVVVR